MWIVFLAVFQQIVVDMRRLWCMACMAFLLRFNNHKTKITPARKGHDGAQGCELSIPTTVWCGKNMT